jgi:DNA-binding NarL/FixJ family response regulator
MHGHQRLLRDGIALALDAEPDLEVVAVVADAPALAEAIDRHRPVDFAVVDLDGFPRAHPLSPRRGVRLVGLTARPADALPEACRLGVTAIVAHEDGLAGLVHAIRRCPVPTVPPLTPREAEVLRAVAEGHSAREIARRLDVSPKTVDNHKHRIYAKLGVQSQAHAVAVATRAGLIRPLS